jgi:hypothetical protein
MTGSDKTVLARQAAEALALRRLRDSGELNEDEYIDRLRIGAPAYNSRLPSALEILERCPPVLVRKKSA